jgi:hypothetical protein
VVFANVFYWLTQWNHFRTGDWMNNVDAPEIIEKEMAELLAITNVA